MSREPLFPRASKETEERIRKGCGLGCAVALGVFLLVLIAVAAIAILSPEEEHSAEDRRLGLHCLNADGHSSGVSVLIRQGLGYDDFETLVTEIDGVGEDGKHAAVVIFVDYDLGFPRDHVLLGLVDTVTCTASLVSLD